MSRQANRSERGMAEIVSSLELHEQLQTYGALHSTLREGLGRSVLVFHDLGPTYTVVRLRVVDGDSDRRANEYLAKELSYPPKDFAGHGRGNRKHLPMFYGSSCERRNGDQTQVTDIKYGLLCALFETLAELRASVFHKKEPLRRLDPVFAFDISDLPELAERRIVYGIWEVRHALKLVRVCPFEVHDHDYFERARFELLFRSLMERNIRHHAEDPLLWRFLARRFQRLGTMAGTDYMTSALATEILVDMGYDGVSYPSVRANSLGTNFAIQPNSVDKTLKLTAVGKAIVRKSNNQLLIEHTDLHHC